MKILMKLMNRLKKINYVCLFFVVYAIREIHLAFDKEGYSHFWHTISLMLPSIVVVTGMMYLLRKRYLVLERAQGYLLILPISFSLLSLHSYTGTIRPILHMIPVLIFLFMSRKDKACIFDYFYWVLQINNIISLFMFMCYKLSIPIGFEPVQRYGAFLTTYYQKWWIFAIYTGRRIGLGGRLCGIFAEPGPLGTVSALLFIARFQYSKTWEKAILLITIFCTRSLAGILLVFIFFVAYNSKINVRNLLIACFGCFFFFLIPYIDFGNTQMNALASRFEITTEGLKGDNRTNAEYDKQFQTFLSAGPIFLGYGTGYQFEGDVIQASYKQIIVEYGLLGFFLLMVIWVFIPAYVARWDRHCLLFIILFILSIYGRPRQIMQIFGYVILLGGLEWMQLKKYQSLNA